MACEWHVINMKIAQNKNSSKQTGRHQLRKFWIITTLWKLAKVERFFHRLPILRRWLKPSLDVSLEDNHAVMIPVQQNISGGESVVLPYQVLTPLIKAATGHLILNQCPCRTAENCHTAPHSFGCLYLGEAVRSVPEGIGQQSSIQQALAHLEQGIQLGLVPMIVHASFDAELLSLPYDRILAICFCCDCCCTVRSHLRLGRSTFDDTIQRLPGLSVTISDTCIGCGSCLERCPVHAIRLENGQAVIDQSVCKGCGLCISVCQVDAPRLKFEEAEQSLEALYDRIRQRTDIGI